MADHIFEYKGHQVAILVDTRGEAQNNWGWSYTIDSGEPTYCRNPRAPSAPAAIRKATRHAQRRIDGLNK